MRAACGLCEELHFLESNLVYGMVFVAERL